MRLHFRQRSFGIMLAAAVAGCGPARLAHLDGRAFAPVGPLVELGNGWVAVDSCSVGLHALVELEIPVEQRDEVDRLLQEIGIALEAGPVWRPRRVQVTGPLCWPAVADRAPNPRTETNATAPSTVCRYVYIVRAEFDLPHLPKDGETVTVVHQNRTVTVRWTRH